MKIAPGIHRIGGNSIINSYLLEQAGEVTIIDAGAPGYYKDIAGELSATGRTLADVRALVLTHGHTDHIGFAERLRRERRVL
jgi:glyoxylase-like metal-dependent hydrolase (beta-lactamase superfamily II)